MLVSCSAALANIRAGLTSRAAFRTRHPKPVGLLSANNVYPKEPSLSARQIVQVADKEVDGLDIHLAGMALAPGDHRRPLLVGAEAGRVLVRDGRLLLALHDVEGRQVALRPSHKGVLGELTGIAGLLRIGGDLAARQLAHPAEQRGRVGTGGRGQQAKGCAAQQKSTHALPLR